MARVESRRDAIRLLERERHEVLSLLVRLPHGARTKRGLGGGEWSPKDLLGHLESWEQHALGAIEAWARGAAAPIDAELRASGVNALNARTFEEKARRAYSRQLASTERTRDRLLDAIASIPDERWASPATSRARTPLGHGIGRILGGPEGPFRHDGAHLPSLRAFVDLHA
jgi:hypothetical protein